ncbi:unnamed protein product [Brassica rapa]|uniref:Uncharacterized protein n=1 Tax=Brassica campestris TaxID=3711 RepID=A0A8D9G0D3_BRACM|nr:unnamed protein product [Brassica rapa]
MCVRVCPCVSISTHRTSVAVHQYTYQHVGPWTQHAGTSPGLFGTHRTSAGDCQHTHDDVCGCPWLSYSTHRTYVAVRVCPCLTHRTSVGVRQHTQDVCGCPCVASVGVRQHTHDVCGFPWLSVSTHRTSVAVCVQHTQDVCGCPSAHTGRPCVSVSTHRTSVCVRQHTQDVRGCPMLVLGLRTLALPVDCLGDFGPRGLSVQYTQDVCGCPPGHTGCPWLSVCVRVCLWVSASTHRTFSMAVHQYTYQHAGPWTQHAGPSRGLFVTHRTSVGVRQHTQDVCGCQWLSVSTHRTFMDVRVCPCVSVGVCQHTQDIPHTRRPLLSISTHIRTLVLGLSPLALPVDFLGDFGPRGLFVQYTGRPWVSASTHMTSVAFRCSWLSVAVCQHTQDVPVCPSAHKGRPCVSVSTHRTSVAVHQYTYQHTGPWTQHAGPSRGRFG